ncbi:MAG: (d)CMP kinase [Micrococcales bacterium]
MTRQIVAIDGPAGSGKSSVSKQLAREFNFGYLDTGAAYRALAWLVMQGLDKSDLESGHFESKFSYQISTDPDNFWVRVGDHDVTEAIRSSEVSEAVSSVAQLPKVRSFMKQLTHQIAEGCTKPGIVIEGRDITTVVYPEAQSRILLTASEEVRLSRRSKELADGKNVHAQVTKRDANDSKVVNFTEAAPGVTLIDSSDLDFAQTVRVMFEQVKHDLKAASDV